MTDPTDAPNSKPFADWVILELMGHRRLAGYLRAVELAGEGFLRLDIPASHRKPPVTQAVSPGGRDHPVGERVYAITPVDEAVARNVADTIWAPPVSRLELTESDHLKRAPHRHRLVEHRGSWPVLISVVATIQVFE